LADSYNKRHLLNFSSALNVLAQQADPIGIPTFNTWAITPGPFKKRPYSSDRISNCRGKNGKNSDFKEYYKILLQAGKTTFS